MFVFAGKIKAKLEQIGRNLVRMFDICGGTSELALDKLYYIFINEDITIN